VAPHPPLGAGLAARRRAPRRAGWRRGNHGTKRSSAAGRRTGTERTLVIVTHPAVLTAARGLFRGKRDQQIAGLFDCARELKPQAHPVALWVHSLRRTM